MKAINITEEELEMFFDAYTEYEVETWCGNEILEDHLNEFVIDLRLEKEGK